MIFSVTLKIAPKLQHLHEHYIQVTDQNPSLMLGKTENKPSI